MLFNRMATSLIVVVVFVSQGFSQSGLYDYKIVSPSSAGGNYQLKLRNNATSEITFPLDGSRTAEYIMACLTNVHPDNTFPSDFIVPQTKSGGIIYDYPIFSTRNFMPGNYRVHQFAFYRKNLSGQEVDVIKIFYSGTSTDSLILNPSLVSFKEDQVRFDYLAGRLIDILTFKFYETSEPKHQWSVKITRDTSDPSKIISIDISPRDNY